MALDSEILLNPPETDRLAEVGRAGAARFCSRSHPVRCLRRNPPRSAAADLWRPHHGAAQASSIRLPGYVRYQRPPVVEPIGPLVLDSGERLEGQIKYYDYGVLSVVFELPFSGDWDTLVRMGSRWVWDVDFEKHASRIVREETGAGGSGPDQALSGMVERGLFHFPRQGDCGLSIRLRAMHLPGRCPRPAAMRCLRSARGRTPLSSGADAAPMARTPARWRASRRGRG